MIRAFEAGGADYVLQPFNTGVLPARVRTRSRLGRLSSDLEAALRMREASPGTRIVALSMYGDPHYQERMFEAGAMAYGNRTREIAEMLGISGKTVETYRGRVMLKLGIDNLPGLVKFAILAGITSPQT